MKASLHSHQTQVSVWSRSGKPMHPCFFFLFFSHSVSECGTLLNVKRSLSACPCKETVMACIESGPKWLCWRLACSSAGGTLGRFLVHEGVGLIDELIDWWIHNWMGFQEVGQGTEACLCGNFLLLAAVRGAVSFITCFYCHHVRPHLKTKTVMLAHHGMTPLERQLAKVNYFPLRFDLLGYFVTMTEVINTEAFFLHVIFRLKLCRSLSMKRIGHILYLDANASPHCESKNTLWYSWMCSFLLPLAIFH